MASRKETTMPVNRKRLRTTLFELVPADGSAIGNARLRKAASERLGHAVDEDEYVAQRDALIAERLVVTGQGRGGAVRRTTPTSANASRSAGAIEGSPPLAADKPATTRKPVRLAQQQLEAHLWGAANILRGKTAGQDYKNYILSLMFYKRLSDQWEGEAEDAIAELERQQNRIFTEQQRAVFRKRGEHRFQIPDGSRWGDVKAASTNLGEVLTKAMRVVADANDELRGVFTVD